MNKNYLYLILLFSVLNVYSIEISQLEDLYNEQAFCAELKNVDGFTHMGLLIPKEMFSKHSEPGQKRSNEVSNLVVIAKEMFSKHSEPGQKRSNEVSNLVVIAKEKFSKRSEPGQKSSKAVPSKMGLWLAGLLLPHCVDRRVKQIEEQRELENYAKDSWLLLAVLNGMWFANDSRES